jgi:predicted PurR-regulated permease PerM
MQSDEPGPAAAPDLSGQSLDAKIIDLIIRLIVVGFFGYLSLTLLAPFFIVVVWAVILAVALYPAFAALRRLLGGRGGLAATLITLLGVGLIVVPLGAVTINVADTTLGLVADFENQTVTVPRPPESVREWPVIGERVHEAWSLASTNLEAAVTRLGPPLLQTAGAVVGKIAGVGFGMLGFAVSVVVAGFLFVPPGPGSAPLRSRTGCRAPSRQGRGYTPPSPHRRPGTRSTSP